MQGLKPIGWLNLLPQKTAGSLLLGGGGGGGGGDGGGGACGVKNQEESSRLRTMRTDLSVRNKANKRR